MADKGGGRGGAGAGSSFSSSAEAGIPSIPSAGASDATVKANASTQQLFIKFCTHESTQGAYPFAKWEDVTADTLCSCRMYERFAHFVTHTYKTAKDKNYAMSTALAEIRRLFQLAKARYGGVDSWAPFFASVDATDTNQASWFHGLLRNIERTFVRRSLKAGEDLVSSAAPISRRIVLAVMRALVRERSKESIKRRLMLDLVYHGCGRGSEVATLTWNLLSWDETLGTAYFVWTQLKTSKQKLVLLLPGVERHGCIFKAFADAFAMGVFEVNKRSASTGNDWLFPEYVSDSGRESSIAAALSSWLKQLVLDPKNTNKTYEAHRVPELPLEPSSGGLRVGAINDMLPFVSPEHIVQVSGHDLTSVSAMYEYVTGSTVPGCIPGACLANRWCAS